MTMAKPRSSGVDRVKLRHAVDSGAAMVALALTGLLAGAFGWMLGWQSAADLAWAITTAIAVPPVTISLLQRLRHGSLGVDLIALLALAGALAYHQYVAGALISLMFATGQALAGYGGGGAPAGRVPAGSSPHCWRAPPGLLTVTRDPRSRPSRSMRSGGTIGCSWRWG